MLTVDDTVAWITTGSGADADLADGLSDYESAIEDISAAVAVILETDGTYATLAELLGGLNTHLDSLATCLAIESGGCTCDTAGSGASASEDACVAGESELGDDGVALFN